MSGQRHHRRRPGRVRPPLAIATVAAACAADALLPGRPAGDLTALGPSPIAELGIPALILFGAGAIAAVALRRLRRGSGRPDVVLGSSGRPPGRGDGGPEVVERPPPPPLVVTAEGLESRYGLTTCRAVAARMTDELLDRGETLFRLLAESGQIDSDALGRALGSRPAAVAGLLSTPLMKLLRDIGLPPPYDQIEDPARRRRIWMDRGGAAGRLLAAIRDEQLTRPAFTSRLSANFGNLEVRPGASAAYAALTDFLSVRVAEDEVVLSLDDVEELIGERLPRSAHSQPRWWTNRTDGPGRGQAAAWLSAGRRAEPDLAERRIGFRRVG